MLTQYSSSRHASHRLKPHMTIIRITSWITPWSSLDLLLTTLKPTYGVQELPKDKPFKNSSKQTLDIEIVINYQNHTWGLDALSISPILVIDDNLFERVYIWNEKNKTGWVHRLNSHIIYACVNELEFHCIYWQSWPSGVSSIYSTMQGKCLRTNQKHKTQFP